MITRKEMIIALIENPKRKGRIVLDIEGCNINNFFLSHVIIIDGIIKYEETKTSFPLVVENDKTMWEIIEPKVNFAEAVKAHNKERTIESFDKILFSKSIPGTEGITFATDEQIDNLWIIH